MRNKYRKNTGVGDIRNQCNTCEHFNPLTSYRTLGENQAFCESPDTKEWRYPIGFIKLDSFACGAYVPTRSVVQNEPDGKDVPMKAEKAIPLEKQQITMYLFAAIGLLLASVYCFYLTEYMPALVLLSLSIAYSTGRSPSGLI